MYYRNILYLIVIFKCTIILNHQQTIYYLQNLKVENDIDVPQGTRKCMDCQFEVEKVKAQGHRTSKPQEIVAYLAYMFTYGQVRRRVQGLTIVRPNLP